MKIKHVIALCSLILLLNTAKGMEHGNSTFTTLSFIAQSYFVTLAKKIQTVASLKMLSNN